MQVSRGGSKGIWQGFPSDHAQEVEGIVRRNLSRFAELPLATAAQQAAIDQAIRQSPGALVRIPTKAVGREYQGIAVGGLGTGISVFARPRVAGHGDWRVGAWRYVDKFVN